MISLQLETFLHREFGMPMTEGQQTAAGALARFIADPNDDLCFLLRGYAGTGKTSLVGALVRVMRRLRRDTVLLAPTGRAAKIFAEHSGIPASTIHRRIYRQKTFDGEGTRFALGFNKLRHALFIVDEASMIAMDAGGNLFGSGLLLDDLIRYVYEGEGCRLLLVGDTAQLPPVSESESPALCPDVLRGYGLCLQTATLTEVVRQREDSDVLSNATALRNLLDGGGINIPALTVADDGEVRYLGGAELIEALEQSYHEYGISDTIVVTRSNKQANRYNLGIRSRVFDRDDRIGRGDLVMAVKNNYFWIERLARDRKEKEKEVLPMDFIANGDTAVVERICGEHEMYGFTFAEAMLRFPDYDDFELECRVLLDTLESESPSLRPEESRRLYESVLADYDFIPSKRERLKRVREDGYYNAVQLKFAYAVTCHKAQGGQWSHVYVDQGWLPPDVDSRSYLRWLYTALTRATGRVYLVNWPQEQLGRDVSSADRTCPS